jgi:hypothetical protein
MHYYGPGSFTPGERASGKVHPLHEPGHVITCAGNIAELKLCVGTPEFPIRVSIPKVCSEYHLIVVMTSLAVRDVPSSICWMEYRN